MFPCWGTGGGQGGSATHRNDSVHKGAGALRGRGGAASMPPDRPAGAPKRAPCSSSARAPLACRSSSDRAPLARCPAPRGAAPAPGLLRKARRKSRRRRSKATAPFPGAASQPTSSSSFALHGRRDSADRRSLDRGGPPRVARARSQTQTSSGMSTKRNVFAAWLAGSELRLLEVRH